MSKDWPTKDKDLIMAEKIIEDYVTSNETNTVGLFEVILSENKEDPEINISDWVLSLANYYHNEYGKEQGDIITGKVVSKCIINQQTIH